MIAKTIEIRDRATFVPALAIRLEPSNEADRFLRLFMESAHFAGLLESEPDPKAQSLKFRPGVVREAGVGTDLTDRHPGLAAESVARIVEQS